MQLYKYLLTFSLLIPVASFSQNLDLQNHFGDMETSKIMLLGTFHFKDAGLDDYKPVNSIDILSPEKQKELQEVLEKIKDYAPTKIALEVKKSNQTALDSLYMEYLAENFELPENEIYQLGFRLAKMLGHKKVYAVDAEARWYADEMTEETHFEKQQYFIGKADKNLVEREMKMDELYMELYKKKDSLKLTMPLLDYLVLLNQQEMIRTGHGHYLIGSFKMGEAQDYYGPDMATYWYNRNLRIFQNLLQLNNPGEDRIFLLIGAGHLPILNFLTESSPDFELVAPQEYLKN